MITSIQKISKCFAVGIAEKNPITAIGGGNQGKGGFKFLLRQFAGTPPALFMFTCLYVYMFTCLQVTGLRGGYGVFQ